MSNAMTDYKPFLRTTLTEVLATRCALLYQQHQTAAISQYKPERAEYSGVIKMTKVRSQYTSGK